MTRITTPVNWRALNAEAIFERLESRAGSLDEEQAKERLEITGPNSLETEAGVSAWRLLTQQVHTGAQHGALLAIQLARRDGDCRQVVVGDAVRDRRAH